MGKMKLGLTRWLFFSFSFFFISSRVLPVKHASEVQVRMAAGWRPAGTLLLWGLNFRAFLHARMLTVKLLPLWRTMNTNVLRTCWWRKHASQRIFPYNNKHFMPSGRIPVLCSKATPDIVSNIMASNVEGGQLLNTPGGKKNNQVAKPIEYEVECEGVQRHCSTKISGTHTDPV